MQRDRPHRWNHPVVGGYRHAELLVGCRDARSWDHAGVIAASQRQRSPSSSGYKPMCTCRTVGLGFFLGFVPLPGDRPPGGEAGGLPSPRTLFPCSASIPTRRSARRMRRRPTRYTRTPAAEGDAGEARDVQLPGPLRLEVPLHQRSRPRAGRIRRRGADRAGPGDAPPPVSAHQPLHGAPGHDDARPVQVLPHLQAATQGLWLAAPARSGSQIPARKLPTGTVATIVLVFPQMTDIVLSASLVM